jgi:arylsulfate sulfotransferase
MKIPNKTVSFFIGLLAVPAFATISVPTLTPSVASPQPIGTSITFTTTATDTGTGPLAFQFLITPPGGSNNMVKDFVPGTLSDGTWTGPSFVWVPTGIEGSYKIQVVAKDFVSGKENTRTITYVVNPLVTGSTPVVEKTANPLVALLSAPACAKGSEMRAAYQEHGKTAVLVTNWVACHPPNTMTFEVAGMYPSTAYTIYPETNTGGTIKPGTKLSFTTGALPRKTVPFPTFTGSPAGTDTANPVILHNFITFSSGGTTTIYPDVATDLHGNITWYYYPNDATHSDVLTRPLPGGGTLTLQDDLAWDPTVTQEQYLRQIDLAGNVVRETNMGAIQHELTALGAVDGGSCTGITDPTVGTACAGSFHHDAIQTLPNGYMAALLDVERIYPIGTQGDTSGKPVDIIGDMIIVMNANWQVVWYWDVFDPNGGGQGYPQLPVTQTAPLGETCGASTSGCPPMFLLASNISSVAHDWLHANSLYYWPAPQNGNTTGGDLVLSLRHQDRVLRINYKDGAGDGSIVWQMGPPDDGLLQPSNFTLTNTWNDPWPWFSHQHDVGIENGGSNPMTLFDNGDTRVVADPPLGLGGTTGEVSNCKPDDCDSRGMVLTITSQPSGATNGVLTPVASFDLAGYSTAMGSAQLLSDGNYFFVNPIVFVLAKLSTFAYSEEVSSTSPPAPEVGAAVFDMNLEGPQQYRGWQMPSLYNPPTT